MWRLFKTARFPDSCEKSFNIGILEYQCFGRQILPRDRPADQTEARRHICEAGLGCRIIDEP